MSSADAQIDKPIDATDQPAAANDIADGDGYKAGQDGEANETEDVQLGLLNSDGLGLLGDLRGKQGVNAIGAGISLSLVTPSLELARLRPSL